MFIFNCFRASLIYTASEFQDRQGFLVRFCLKKPKPNPKQAKQKTSCSPGWPETCYAKNDLELLPLLFPLAEHWGLQACITILCYIYIVRGLALLHHACKGSKCCASRDTAQPPQTQHYSTCYNAWRLDSSFQGTIVFKGKVTEASKQIK